MAQICSLSQPVRERIKPRCPKEVVLKLERVPQSPGGPEGHRLRNPTPGVSDTGGRDWNPRVRRAASARVLVQLGEKHFGKAAIVGHK